MSTAHLLLPNDSAIDPPPPVSLESGRSANSRDPQGRNGRKPMHIIDSHFHWWPRSVFDKLCQRKNFPRAGVNKNGGYDYWRREGAGAHLNSWAGWFDLDEQFAHMGGLGPQVD